MQPLWRSLVSELEIPAKPDGIWTRVLDYVGPSRRLLFTATGRWVWQDPASQPPSGVSAYPKAPDPKGECGPDGDLGTSVSEECLSPDALPGALIGKIGGSSASVKNTSAFAVGSYCVLEVAETSKGPLFLTINDAPLGMADNSGKLLVSIWEAF